jgi:hypothetical protein
MVPKGRNAPGPSYEFLEPVHGSHQFVITTALQLNLRRQYIRITFFCMKTDTLQIRLHPKEKQAFELAAELSGIALSSWVRERLRHSAIRELEEAGRQIPFLQNSEGGSDGN